MNKFEYFINTINSTNIKIDEYVDWKKIQKNMLNIQFDCNQLTFFLSNTKEDFLNKFNNFYTKSKKSFKILPLLLAIRKTDIKYCIFDDKVQFNYLDKNNVLNFIEASGLLDNLFLNKACKDIFTYCFGVEVGLSSNSIKNKSGKWSSEIFEKILIKNNVKKFKKEVLLSDYINMNDLNNEFNKKRLDYAFEYKKVTYLVELNYFNTSGSKINGESSRLMSLNNFINEYCKNNKIKNLVFLYITDGVGWLSNLNQLKVVLEVIENCFNFELLQKLFFNNNESSKKYR